ncbi:type VII secretion protein EsaA [Desemzia incerta]|uniref:type VII secretion protein EsaA n=1 Tax=Desemzia incerta TaxID=82801 RepID=UPI003D089E5F
MKKKRRLWLKIGAAIIVFAGLLFVLSNQVLTAEQAGKEVKEAGTEKAVDVKSKMAIAIVNEDEGTVVKGADYTLGANYIKQIEKNEEYDWYVVSRGSAESGLNEGLYQLMLIIPNNFSAKVLDMNETNPEKVAIEYRVNANGNNELETEATRVGNEIVNGLNQQLVDVYVATILVNLSQAQNNVQEVVDGNNTNMGSYEDQVYGTALNFENAIPTIKDHTSVSLESNERLTDTLAENTAGFAEYSQSLLEYDSQLMEYISKLNNDTISYETFMENILSMDAALLNQETEELFNSIQASNEVLLSQFQRPTGPVKTVAISGDTYASEYARLESYMNEMNTKVAQQEELLDKQLETVNSFVEEQLTEVYGKESDISLRTFLQSHEENTETSSFLAEIALKEERYYEEILQRVGTLPYFKINDDIKEQLTLIQNEEVNEMISAVNKNTPYLEGFEMSPNKNLIQEVSEAADVLKKFIDRTEEKAFHFEIDNTEKQIEDGAKLKVVFPDGIDGNVLVNGVAVAEEPFVLKDLDNIIKIDGTYKIESLPEDEKGKQQIKVEILQEKKDPTPIYGTPSALPQSGTDSDADENTEDEESSSIQEVIPSDNNEETEPVKPIIDWNEGKAGVHYVFYEEVDYYSDLAGLDYRNAVNEYANVIGEVERLYKDVFVQLGITDTEINTPVFDEYSKIVGNFLDRDVKDYLTEVITNTLTANITGYSQLAKQQIDVRSTMVDLTQQLPILAEKMTTIRTTAQNNAEQINRQLQLLSSWQEQIQTVTALGTDTGENQQLNSTTAGDIYTNLGQILQTSGNLKTDSESTVEMATSVKDVFQSFDEDVEVLELSSGKLTTDAGSLMNQFQEQVRENNQFAGDFVDVLSNAHQNGVLNETVMDFIANPVEKEFKGSIKAAEKVNPFTWVLMIYGISLFAGYLVATNNVVFLKKDDFDESNAALKMKGYPLFIILGISIVLGLIEGMISGAVLGVPFENTLKWTGAVVLLSVVFSVINYGLIKLFKNMGLGISMFFLISYVFVTESIGTAANLTGFADVIRTVNPLMLGEKTMRALLQGQSSVEMILLLVVLAIIVSGILLVVGKKPAKQEVA